jgi:GSH-dependent disulfide-bond oxidoreductase
METKRQLDVLDRRLSESEFVAGADYTIADMAIWPWYGQLALGKIYDDANEFLATHEYEHVQRWARQIAGRAAVKQGRIVNRTSGELHEQLRERHDAGDFELRTQDKLEPAE